MNHPSVRPVAVAVFDIGTNTTKLVIAEVEPSTGAITENKFLKETTRIGEGLATNGEISASALLRTVNAIERFLQVVHQYDCEHVFAFSTYALRSAANGKEAASRIEAETGIDIRILSGEEEARFAYSSARAHLGPLEPESFLIDVGGGSTEFLHACRDQVLEVRSLPLGALYLTERFLESDPIDKKEYARLRSHVSAVVTPLFEGLIPQAGRTGLVASGGSVVTIKKMSNRSQTHTAVTTPKIRIGDIRRLQAQCLALPLEKRKRLPGIEPDRADIIPAGLAVVIAFMEAAHKKVLRINPGGVRDGALIHLVQNNFRW